MSSGKSRAGAVSELNHTAWGLPTICRSFSFLALHGLGSGFICHFTPGISSLNNCPVVLSNSFKSTANHLIKIKLSLRRGVGGGQTTYALANWSQSLVTANRNDKLQQPSEARVESQLADMWWGALLSPFPTTVSCRGMWVSGFKWKKWDASNSLTRDRITGRDIWHGLSLLVLVLFLVFSLASCGAPVNTQCKWQGYFV